MVQWLRLCASNAGGTGSTPGWGIKFPPTCCSTGKEFTCNARDLGSTPVLRRSPGEGKGFALQYSDLENSRDCIVHGVTKSRTRLSDFHFHFTYCVEGPNKNIINKQTNIL